MVRHGGCLGLGLAGMGTAREGNYIVLALRYNDREPYVWRYLKKLAVFPNVNLRLPVET